MTIATYGEHAENAARALNALILDDLIPAETEAVDQLLHYREAVVDALRQRLYDLGHDSWYPPPHQLPARTPKPTLAGIDEKLATLVDNIAFALPSLRFDERRSRSRSSAPRRAIRPSRPGDRRHWSCWPAPTPCPRPASSRGGRTRGPAGG